MPEPENALLGVKNLRIHFFTGQTVIRAIDGIDLNIYRSRTLCLVGEPGSGKSTFCRGLVNFYNQPGRLVLGNLLLNACLDGSRSDTVDLTLLQPEEKDLHRVRDTEIAFLAPQSDTSLDLLLTIGEQIVKKIRVYLRVNQATARRNALDLLGRLGIPCPKKVLDQYPYELSKMILYRVNIAMTLAGRPRLLVADNPFTGMEFTEQVQLINQIRDLQNEFGFGLVLATDELNLVSQIADDVAVLHQGKVIELARTQTIFNTPSHPYMKAYLTPTLVQTSEAVGRSSTSLHFDQAIQKTGCPFFLRCPSAMPECSQCEPRLVTIDDGHDVRCLISEMESLSVRMALPEPRYDVMNWYLERLLQ